MYLKKLYINGFKSFARPVELAFDKNVSAIVGPNGSGKSNITDAVRFVLGEQRTKSMRSQKMGDIIFSGTDKARAKGAAEVRLTLERDDAPDIVIARKLFRTGESVFTINGAKVRLKDIHAFFADTGLGKNGYSIVGQGGIENIVGAGPAELRALVEEAAGIAGYKARRDETEKRLEKTQDNISRVEDILSEMKKQLAPLSRQAEKTRRYLEIYESVRAVDLTRFYDAHTADTQEIKKLTEALSQSEFRLFDGEKQTEQKDKAYTQNKEKRAALAAQVRAAEQALEENRLRCAGLEREQAVEENACKNARENFARAQKALAAHKESVLTAARDYESVQTELKAAQAAFSAAQETGQAAQAAVRRAQAALDQQLCARKAVLAQQAEQNAAREAAREELLALKTEAARHEAALQNDSARRKALEKTVDGLTEQREALGPALSAARAQAQSARTARARAAEALQDARQRSVGLYKTLQELSARRQTLESQLEYQQNLKRAYSGYHNSVRAVMRFAQDHGRDDVYGPVAELVETAPDYTRAVQAALGAKAQNIVVKNEAAAQACIRYLKKSRSGRATFLPLSALHPAPISKNDAQTMAQAPGFVGIAATLCRTRPLYAPALEALLGRVAVLEDFNAAAAFRARFPRYTAVTRGGEIFYPGGAVVGGSTGKETQSVLFKSAEIDRLQRALQDLKNDLDASRAEYKALSAALPDLEKTAQRAREKAEAAEQERWRLSEQDARLAEEQKVAREALDGTQRADGAALEEKRARIAALEDFLNAPVPASEDETQIERCRAQVLERHEQWTQAQLTESARRQKLESLEARIETLKAAGRSAKKQVETCAGECAALQQEAEARQKRAEALQAEAAAGVKQNAALRAQVEAAREALSQTERAGEALEAAIKVLSRAQMLETDVKNKIAAQRERRVLEQENRENRIYDLYQVNAVMLADSGALARFREQAADVSESTYRALKAEISKIGSVDTDAVEAHRALQARYDALSSQHRDLLSAREDIEGVIRALNTSMAEQFAGRFDALNQKFSEIFQVLFEGGSAQLSYTDPEHILTSGVELSAQPPGKNLKHLSLLSGGEKAMTAIALLFAFIDENPAPFCIIDEIDAALDDSNIERFTRYIERRQGGSQFIIITHRKNTLRICDKINGVTMGSDGVSRLLALTVSEYTEE